MERLAHLLSMNTLNFRHGQENPMVLGFVNYTPKGYKERPCFRVLYESDYKIDYVPLSEITNGNWQII